MNKISIKEAGRYSNFISAQTSEIVNLLSTDMRHKLIETTELHKKSLAIPELEDEIIVLESNSTVDYELEELTEIMSILLDEKRELSKAIADAKKEIEIKDEKGNIYTIDSALETAITLRNIATRYFGKLASAKERKLKQSERGYTFNLEKNQVTYTYEKEVTEKLEYDRNEYKRKEKEMKLEADTLSDNVEKAMNLESVNFDPRYSYLDEVEDIVKKYREGMLKK